MTELSLDAGAGNFGAIVNQKALRDLTEREIDDVVGGVSFQLGPYGRAEVDVQSRLHHTWGPFGTDWVDFRITVYVNAPGYSEYVAYQGNFAAELPCTHWFPWGS